MTIECEISGERCGFRCTGYDGSHKWRQLHEIVESIECEECRDHAVKLMRALHDHVNVGLGKPAFDEENYLQVLDELVCARDSYCRDGHCQA